MRSPGVYSLLTGGVELGWTKVTCHHQYPVVAGLSPPIILINTRPKQKISGRTKGSIVFSTRFKHITPTHLWTFSSYTVISCFPVCLCQMCHNFGTSTRCVQRRAKQHMCKKITACGSQNIFQVNYSKTNL